ncbi:aldose epimerase family protein [Lewinella sp. LCG006]|uniref:aldose epimerase family protein n=1 Tax=Lewinella sp. LCG006 TaxID=3231911 RepID=UPI0034602636
MNKFKPTPFPAFLLLLLGLLAFSCKNEAAPPPATPEEVAAPAVTITKSAFGTTPEGQEVDKYVLKNEQGMTIEVITYGGIITSWTAPDREGNYQNIVLGYDKLSQYVESNPYFGAIIGRYGNRIAKGQFTLDGKTYQLETNDGPNHLHGGVKGFDKVVWSATENPDGSLALTYVSKDMEGGYPGELTSTVVYQLTADNTLEVTYEATTDKPTIVNLTQHSYFNLSGDFSQKITDHVLTIDAATYLPVDETLIPTGELRAVAGTPFDFTKAKAIGQDIEVENEQLARGKGFDHCWVLNKQGTYREAATLLHPASGRYLEILTDEPGIQFYSGNFLDGTLPAPGGGTYGQRTGLCLETQHYPDSPNQPTFPAVSLQPGEKYASKTTFKLSTKTN